MQTAAQESPRPPQGAPRWVLMTRQPPSPDWRLGAESPYRAAVLHALGEMTQTVRARGGDLTVALWGPDGDGSGWQRYDTTTPSPAPAPGDEGAASPAGSTALTERMTDRRRQVLMAGLSRAGRYDLTPDDLTAVQTVVDRLDETTVRRLAHWLGTP
ncbi:hypothetical protein [Streptomyces sp. NPDC057877]|uniref:hypothetical protein n=1 Tax=Streptomyces sp. NPDC057877 TaxID=3346269 RepID=UPI003688CE6F